MKNKKSLGQIVFEAFWNKDSWPIESKALRDNYNRVAKAVEREVKRRMKAPKKIGKKGTK